MEMKKLQEKKNPHLSRDELILEISSTSTPKKEEVRDLIKKDKELVVVRNVHSPFGKNKFIAEVLVYDSIEAKKVTEVISRKERDKIKEEKKAKMAEEKKKKDEAKKTAEGAK